MTRKPKSRQAAWQADRKARNLCVQCGKRPLATSNHCRECADVQNARNLASYYARIGGESAGGEVLP